MNRTAWGTHETGQPCRTPRCVGYGIDHYAECSADFRPLVSLFKRATPVLPPRTPVEYVTDEGAWARASVRQASGTGNVWLKVSDGNGWALALPTEVRRYR